MPPQSPSARSEAPAATLRAGQLGTAEITASTVANIGPGIDFYFGFGVIAATAGVAAPLTIVAAGVATLLLAYVVSEFTRAEPSAGSFITYVESAFGPRFGVLTASLVAIGYTVAIAAVFTMSGGVVALILAHYASWEPPWEPLSLVFTAGAIWLAARGVRISTAVVGIAVVSQVLVMVAVCAVVLIDERHVLSTIPFQWSHVTGGLAGLSAGFPLAIYMFIGWENGPALAEEARDPRRTIPRALNIAVVATTVLFVLFAYATVTGFHYDVSSVGRASIPFLSVAEKYTGDFAVLAWLVGAVSVFATLIAAVNSQSRMLFDAGRSGLLPRWLGRLRSGHDTPLNALVAMAVAGLSIIAVWWLAHATGVASGSTDPVGLYAECSTMGTIVIFVVYALTAAALPVFIWRRHRSRFSLARHIAVPILGGLAIAIPFVELCRPGQPYPYNVFPYLALAIVALSAVYAVVALRRDPTAGAGETTRFEGHA